MVLRLIRIARASLTDVKDSRVINIGAIEFYREMERLLIGIASRVLSDDQRNPDDLIIDRLVIANASQGSFSFGSEYRLEFSMLLKDDSNVSLCYNVRISKVHLEYLETDPFRQKDCVKADGDTVEFSKLMFRCKGISVEIAEKYES